jgi:voltage-gated potassium channel
MDFRESLRGLYEGRTSTTRWFLYGLLGFDFASLLYIIATSFIARNNVTRALDLIVGLVFLVEFIARLFAIRRPARELARITTWTDVAAIVSLIASASGEAAGFLRILRTLRLLRSFRVAEQLKQDSAFFRRHEEVVAAVANLSVFIFVMTGIVYETQRHVNPNITNYADALYFTVTALTTTGFGDITLPGTLGRLITVVIMIFGVTLFLNLAKVLFNPTKVRFTCPACGLQRHDRDAVHCKACGIVIDIPDDGI